MKQVIITKIKEEVISVQNLTQYSTLGVDRKDLGKSLVLIDEETKLPKMIHVSTILGENRDKLNPDEDQLLVGGGFADFEHIVIWARGFGYPVYLLETIEDRREFFNS